MHDNEDEKLERDEMHRREITLADGRYMIFYTFGDDRPEAEEMNDQREDV
jgi:hypothetical protein